MAESRPTLRRMAVSRLTTSVIGGLAVLSLVAALGLIVGIGNYDRNPSGGPGDEPKLMSQADQMKVANDSGSNPFPCVGNQQDSCKSAPTIDFWPAGEEGATNPGYAPAARSSIKMIMGRIVSNNNHVLIIKTSSGRDFTIQYPLDPIAHYNQVAAANEGVSVAMGDAIFVTYSEYWGTDSTDISVNQLDTSALVLDNTNYKQSPSSPLQKY